MKVTVITVCYNDKKCLERTISSVTHQDYLDFEYVIVDGGSTDGSLDVIKSETRVDTYISEPDKGIYDAMNKGISLASGEWLVFMNAGDIFASNYVLSEIFNNKQYESIDFIYSDFCVRGSDSERFYTASYKEGVLLHQSVIYRKTLHSKHGLYYVSRPYTVSDYLFFMQVDENKVAKVQTLISINDIAGVSGNYTIALQKYCTDYVFNRISYHKLLFELLVRPIKYKIKEILSII